jgi:hypothetical protein
VLLVKHANFCRLSQEFHLVCVCVKDANFANYLDYCECKPTPTLRHSFLNQETSLGVCQVVSIALEKKVTFVNLY